MLEENIKVGFIGVGAIGMPMAENLLEKSMDLYAYHFDQEFLKPIEEKGGIGISDLNEFGSICDLIFMCLPNAGIVEEIVLTPGFLEHCKKNCIIVDMSTVSPKSTKRIAEKVNSYNLRYADAPISGGVTGARASTLTIMVGSDKETYEEILPILHMLGKKIYHIGPIGSGDAIKMVNNLLLGCNMAAISEALQLGQHCGLPLEVMKEVIGTSSGSSYVFDAKMDKFIIPENFEPGFSIDLQYKDLMIAIEEGTDARTPLPMTSTALQIFESARKIGLGNKDISSVVNLYR